MKDKYLGKPINTCISAGSEVTNDSIAEVKDYLAKKYNNRYNMRPHITYMICPLPEKNLKKLIPELDRYFSKKKTFSFKLSSLNYEPKRKFFSMPVIGNGVMDFHRDLVRLFTKYRDGCIREKDLKSVEQGIRNADEIEYIKKYGYFRILDRFTPHITVGNVEAEENEIQEIKNTIEEKLKGVIDVDINVTEIHVPFFYDSEIQSDLKDIWFKDYILH